jgi:hypothetical protein
MADPISVPTTSEWQRLAQIPVEKFEDAMQEPTVAERRRAIRETLGEPPAKPKRAREAGRSATAVQPAIAPRIGAP